MINYVIPIVAQFISTGILQYAVFPVFCLAFLASFPRLISYLFGRR